MFEELILPALIAGMLTFLAPCTLPLIPAFLGMMSGATSHELREHGYTPRTKRNIFFNGLFFVLGFSLVFILLGMIFGFVGSSFVAYRDVLSRIGGVFVIFFGLFLLGAFHIRILEVTRRIPLPAYLRPSTKASAMIMGATFGLGWTPCIGPILGTILFLASTTQTVIEGGALLSVFSLGLAIPFLLLALLAGHASSLIKSFSRLLRWTQVIGGVFLILLGILLVTDSFDVWIRWLFQVFHFIRYEGLLQYL